MSWTPARAADGTRLRLASTHASIYGQHTHPPSAFCSIELSVPLLPDPREEGGRPAHRVRPDPHQPTVEHALDRLWDLRLALLWPAPPGAQEQAVRQVRLLTEARHQLEADQVALLLGERGFGSAGHGRPYHGE